MCIRDRIKKILDEIQAQQREPAGDDRDLIDRLGSLAESGHAAPQLARAEPAPRAEPNKPEKIDRPDGPDRAAPERSEDERSDRQANHSIRVTVETLDHLMITVSELVLTRNQLLEIVRRNEDSDFKVPLQRLSNVTAELQEGVMKTRMQPIGNAWQKLPRVVRDLSLIHI